MVKRKRGDGFNEVIEDAHEMGKKQRRITLLNQDCLVF